MFFNLNEKELSRAYTVNMMAEETGLFFRHVLDNNLPALELLSANYSFLNRDLAKLYGIEHQTAFSKAAEF